MAKLRSLRALSADKSVPFGVSFKVLLGIDVIFVPQGMAAAHLSVALTADFLVLAADAKLNRPRGTDIAVKRDGAGEALLERRRVTVRKIRRHRERSFGGNLIALRIDTEEPHSPTLKKFVNGVYRAAAAFAVKFKGRTVGSDLKADFITLKPLSLIGNDNRRSGNLIRRENLKFGAAHCLNIFLKLLRGELRTARVIP